MEAIAVVYYTS